ncbi:hypothetical protein [Pelagibius sp. 7325]|uniref:hypothetical protein n=1 Tax=Pelagibius sp. 7325 TaxID=3131994 RepID=UPI0030EC215A
MTDSTSDKIIAECAIAFSSNSDDCNKFVKAVAAVFFEPDLFSGPGMNADAIIAEVEASGDWTKHLKSHTGAIKAAKAGRFVVAGMTSRDLASSHGHLAVVVGDDGANSGDVLVPICYAGSLNASARVERKRVSETFGASHARKSEISYFSRPVQTVPEAPAVGRLVDFLRGVRVEPQLVSARSKKSKHTKGKKSRGKRGSG